MNLKPFSLKNLTSTLNLLFLALLLFLIASTILFGFLPKPPRHSSRSAFATSSSEFFSLHEAAIIKSIIEDSSFCQRYYQTLYPTDEYVCWWLHSENATDKSLLPWLQMATDKTSTEQVRDFQNSLQKQALHYYFRPRLSLFERNWLLVHYKISFFVLILTIVSFNVTSMCLSVADKLLLPHFIYAGTLMGFVRHSSGIIPWDDDVDIGLVVHRPDEVPMLASALQKMALQMFNGSLQMIYIPQLKRVKCFFNEEPSLNIPGYEWRWPFVDFQFMRYRRFIVTKYVQNMDLIYEYFPMEDVFPLQRVKFGTITVQVPKNPEKIIGIQFRDIDKCQSPSYNHRAEKPYCHFITVPCSKLKNLM